MIKNRLPDIPQIVLLRSDKILHSMVQNLLSSDEEHGDLFDELFDGIRDFYPNNYRLDEMELALSQERIRQSGISSNYNYNNFFGKDHDYSFLDELFDRFYTQNATEIYVKDEQIEDYLGFITKVSPICIIGHRLAREYQAERIDLASILSYVDSYRPLGLHVDSSKSYAENHLHLKGAGYLSFNFSKLISYETPAKYYSKEFLKEIPRINEFSYINNHTFSIGQMVDILKFCKDYIFSSILKGVEFRAKSEAIYREKLAKIVTINKYIGIERGFSLDIISKLTYLIPPPNRNNEQKMVQLIVDYHQKDAYAQACLLESILLFYLYDTTESQMLKRVIKISIHTLNILRSYMLMSQNQGLAHFSEFSGSALREAEKRNAQNIASSIINSGTTHLNAKMASSHKAPQIEDKLLSIINAFETKKSGLKLNFTLSSTKGRERDSGDRRSHLLKPRFYHKRVKLKKETIAIDDFLRNARYKITSRYKAQLRCNPIEACKNKKQLKSMHYDLSRQIVSIDAVGKETHTPPEVFAPHFRYLRELPKKIKHNIFLAHKSIKHHPNLAFSVHAGEDFNHIVTGMRRVDETIKFFGMQRRDRLGHVLSLGLTPQEWIESTNEIILYKGDYLDDLIWLTMKLKALPSVDLNIYKYLHRYTDKVWELFAEIYPMYRGEQPQLTDLYKAWRYRRNCPIAYYRRKRGETLYSIYDQKVLDKEPSPIVKRLYELYQTNGEVRRRYKEPHKIEKSTIKQEELSVWEMIQDYSINEIGKAGIIIETNPSSNLFISSMSSYSNHPIFRFYSPKEKLSQKGEIFNKYGIRDGIVAVTINSDDPAIFATSLQNEYRAIKNIAKERYRCTDKEADIYLDDIRKFGVEVFEDLY